MQPGKPVPACLADMTNTQHLLTSGWLDARSQLQPRGADSVSSLLVKPTVPLGKHACTDTSKQHSAAYMELNDTELNHSNSSL